MQSLHLASESTRFVIDPVEFHDTIYKSHKFVEAHSHMKIQTGITIDGEPIYKLAAQMWLDDGKSPRFERLEFRPGTPLVWNIPRTHFPCLNLWQGHATQPAAGTWMTIYWYLHHVIAGEDQETYEWLMHYLAAAYNDPANRINIFLTLYSDLHGMGKGIFFQLLAWIFGKREVIMVSDGADVVGDFNHLIEGRLFVCMDEALAVNDPKATNKLKSLVTEGTVTINRKGSPQRIVPCYVRPVAATNKSWAAFVEIHDRRNVVIDVHGWLQQDGTPVPRGPLWKAKVDSMKAELAAFCAALVQLGTTAETMPPLLKTEIRKDMITESLTGNKRIMYQFFCDADLPFQGVYRKDNDTLLINKEGLIATVLFGRRPVPTLTKLSETTGMVRWKHRVGASSYWCLEIPADLNTARKHFSAALKTEIKWPEDEGEWGGVGWTETPKRNPPGMV